MWHTTSVFRMVCRAIGVTAMVFGSALLVQQQQLDASLPPRLEPDSPLMAETELETARRGERLARIRIPSIGVDEVVVEGVSPDELAVGVGHYPRTATLGERGSIGIAGHRTGWGDPFLELDELDRGDRIVLESRRNRYVYVVTGTRVVEPSDGWVLKGDPNVQAPYELTLTTCTPEGTSLRRLIVWAKLVA